MADVERMDGGPRSAIVLGIDRGILLRIATGCGLHGDAGLGLRTASIAHHRDRQLPPVHGVGVHQNPTPRTPPPSGRPSPSGRPDGTPTRHPSSTTTGPSNDQHPTRLADRQARDRLEAELAALRRPTTTAAAVDTVDQDEHVPTRHHQRHARIRQIQDLLANAVVGQDPPDDGIAEPGMVLTVSYDDTHDTETFLLGVRGAEHGDVEVYSPDSPWGTALIGARPGQQRAYRVPAGATLRVTLLAAVPDGRHYPHATPELATTPTAPPGATPPP